MANHKIIKKAYTLDFDRISYGGECDCIWCYANNRNKAKSDLLNQLYSLRDEWKLYTYDKISYINIPVIRYKDADLVEFEGREVKRWKIDDIIGEQIRHRKLDAILVDHNIKFCYLIKGGVFYRPNYSGYTEYRSKAGVYTKEDAVSSAKSCSELSIIPIDIVSHNQRIEDEINGLKENLITKV